jgi:hypothetical protein
VNPDTTAGGAVPNVRGGRGVAAPPALIVLYAAVAILLIPIFPHFVSPNEFSRWATTISLVERGDGAIDWSVPLIGITEDTSAFGGSLYSNKPPGTSIAGIPGYLVARLLGADAEAIRLTLTVMRWTASTIPVVLIGLLLVRCGRRLQSGPDQLAMSLAALLFGTPLFAYGLLYFSHALTALGLFIAVGIGFVAPLRDRRLTGLAIGVGLGIAGLSEYTAAIYVIIILATLVLQRRFRELVCAALAGAPFLAALLVYQWWSFGSLFAIANAFESHGEFSDLAGGGIFGIGAPSPVRMLRLLFDPTNGLVLFSPILAGALVFAPRLARALTRQTFWMILLLPLTALALFSGYPNWHGGWSVGPRYLVPVLPLLVLPLLVAPVTRWLCALLGWSVAAVVIVSTTIPFVPNGMVIPWGTLGLGLIREGFVAPNLLHLIAPQAGQTLPWLVVLLPLVAIPSKGRVPAVAGLITCLLAGMLALQLSTPVRTLQRSYIEAVYFENTAAFEREFGRAFSLPEPLRERAERELGRPPDGWPFR